MHGTWVLYTDFKFGWGPAGERHCFLFFVGLTAAVVQAVLSDTLKNSARFVYPDRFWTSNARVCRLRTGKRRLDVLFADRATCSPSRPGPATGDHLKDPQTRARTGALMMGSLAKSSRRPAIVAG